VGCNCKVSLACSAKALAECASQACEKGQTLNNWWQSRADAESCAARWTKKTGVPHYVGETSYMADDAPVARTDYALISCPANKVYDAWFEQNSAQAKTCAEKWNALAKAEGSPIRYEAKRIGSRFLFADIWKVVAKK
jgi:hypothetical protein